MNKTESYDYPLWEQNLEREIQGFYDQDEGINQNSINYGSTQST